jgi:hypothetical protein
MDEGIRDELDGESYVAEEVHFGIDGQEYDIYLNDPHADDLRARLAPYIAAARIVEHVLDDGQAPTNEPTI